jgi:DNA-directed RNA polymerase subunit RPC12/RpoP
MNPQQTGNQAIPQQIQINPEDTTGVVCPQCNSEFFIPVYMLRKVSALISPSGREEIIQVPVMACSQCGTPYMGEGEPQSEGGPIGTPTPQSEDGSTIVGG